MTDSAELRAALDDLLEADVAASPVMASGLGIPGHDGRLDDLSADAFAARDASAADLLARLDAMSEDGLTADERIDRDLARSVLRGRLILAPFEGWRRDPYVYTGPITGGLFTLFLQRLTSEADRVEACVSRLAQAGAAVDAGIANIEPAGGGGGGRGRGGARGGGAVAGASPNPPRAGPPPLSGGRGGAAARSTVRYVRDLVWKDVEDEALRERLRAAGEDAAPHIERWVAHLEAFLPRASGTWQLGEEGYTRILREREVLGDDARSLRERGRAEFERLDAEMTALSREATGNPDYVSVLRDDDGNHPPTEEAMLETYAEWTAKARAFLAETGLVTLPEGETCAVVPSPVFQRPVLGVASYVAPPAFSDRLRGHFFVPFAPDGASDDEIAARLSNNSYGSIPTTSVHEAYPGHHWHLVMRKANPSNVRRVYSTPYFSEGWALYAERVMRERGFFESPMHELHHLNATLFRAARIIVDTSLHLGEMTFEQGVAFMMDKAGLPEPVARAEVGRYCWWPTQASSYLTGCLEILAIREQYLATRGFAGVDPREVPIEVLRDFHDAITSSGALPLGLARRAVLGSSLPS